MSIKAKSYALRLLAIRPRSIKELKDKLALKGYKPQDIEHIIEELTCKNFLNDLEYARVFLRSRISNNPKGVMLLKMELRQRGISDEIINAALSEVKESFSEKDAALKLAQARRRFLGKTEKDAAKKRIYDYLNRRGFTANTIYEVIKELFGKDAQTFE
ncbi:MAG: regulatory protein RecX [Candidatus Omnitrophota bacterium]